MQRRAASLVRASAASLRALDDACARAVERMMGRELLCLVCLCATGIAIYFALPSEPGPEAFAVLAVGVGSLCRLGWRTRRGAGAIALAVAAVAAGVVTAQLRTNAVAAPVLQFRYYGAVEGRVAAVDRSTSGRLRVVLDDVRLDRVPRDRTPHRVRISLDHDATATRPAPGERVMTTAHLMPPGRPVEPDGFDFQRHAWFEGLGAVGYAAAPLLLADRSREGGGLDRLRGRISAELKEVLPGPTGALAAAIVTGDRSDLPGEQRDALRDANLAHLLAISGLHMGLLVSAVYGGARLAFAAIPSIALTYPVRKWAAAAAIPVACVYLALSGGAVATQRAFVMAVVMLGAILVGRRAVSLRSLALAALVVLVLSPESLIGPGFQMSFAATGALIVVFGGLARGDGWWRRGVPAILFGVVVSSAVAGLATAPFAALHFNRVGQYGLLANVLAVPAMGLWVMPTLALGTALLPLGLGTVPLIVAGWGIDWILAVAAWVAALDGAVVGVSTPPPAALPLLGVGGALAVCTAGIGRLAALAPVVAAAVLWTTAERPVLLVAESGGLIGIATPAGRWLSHPTSDGFAAQVWRENDGHSTAGPSGQGRGSVSFGRLVAVRGKRATAEALARCRPGQTIVTNAEPDRSDAPCHVLGPRTLARTGSLAVHVDGETFKVRSAIRRQGSRPWTGGGMLFRPTPDAAIEPSELFELESTIEVWLGEGDASPHETPPSRFRGTAVNGRR